MSAEATPPSPPQQRTLSFWGSLALILFVLLVGRSQFGHVKLGGFDYLGFPAAWLLRLENASSLVFSLVGAILDVSFFAIGCTLICLVDRAIRRRQFSLRTLCLGMLLVAILSGILAATPGHNEAWLKAQGIDLDTIRGTTLWLPKDR